MNYGKVIDEVALALSNSTLPKELCKRLKAIRKAVADANGIEYNPTECHHKGRCPGTCPVCDAEIEAINKALVRKRAKGEDIVIPEVSVEDICHSVIDPP